MKITGKWLTAAGTQAVLKMLTDAGHQGFCVGGCVRNALLDVPVSDVDIATDARPEAVLSLAQAAGIHAVPTGLEHGTITLVIDHAPYEVTTFRRDVATDGRRATVAFSTTITEDARRRDFTMNALYVSADGTLQDPLQGIGDLRARRVRFIEDAGARVAEDYLRILRFFRFHAWFGDPAEGLDPEGLEACAGGLDGLAGISKERVAAEFRKLFAAPDPAPATAAMAACGVLARLLPGADASALGALVHLEDAAGVAPRWQRRLTLLGDVNAAKTLRLSRAEARAIAAARAALAGEGGAAWAAFRHGAEAARDANLIRAAVLSQPLPPDLEAEIARGATARFPLRAADLIAKYGEGPALGAALKRLEARWIASDFKADHAALVAIDKSE